MLYAIVNGSKRPAWPGGRASCPGCHEELIARCGGINIWHWSHTFASDCDRWYEGESQWHLQWKRRVPAAQCEVVMGPHRADIVSITGLVTELQHGSLSPEDTRDREVFYGDMLWIVDAADFEDNLDFRYHDGYMSFRWRWPRKWMFSITRRLIFDFGGWLFEVKKLYSNVPCGGWGYRISEPQLLEDIIGDRYRKVV